MPPDLVDAYLERLGLGRDDVSTDADGLARLHRAHLAAVPFENLDIVFAGGVAHDVDRAIEKIVGGRGGWCFECNGAFAALLEALGLRVVRLGAAVLLDGPSTVLEHLALEVSGGPDDLEPHLVDVGFGDAFDVPLRLNARGPQPGGAATFELLPSPQGTTLAEHVDGVPEARYRFKRVDHAHADFADVARRLQRDPERSWATKPFATRLLDPARSDRVTLTHDRLTLRVDGERRVEDVAPGEWGDVLAERFGIDLAAVREPAEVDRARG